MGTVCGIDLGTTYSCIAVIDEFGKPSLAPNAEGRTLTPSVVALAESPPVVGDEAKQLQSVGDNDVFAFFKRSMGDRYGAYIVHDTSYSPTDLSALVLSKLKRDAEAHTGTTINHAVITVPAYFNNRQREATKAAGEKAGLDVLMTINEPTAAALAFGLGSGDKLGRILVYDLGGGTFDVTLMELTGGHIQVFYSDGDHELGGKDWDDRLAQRVAGRFSEEHGSDPLEDALSFNDLFVACENAKQALSSAESTRLGITHDGIRASYEITRAEFEEMTTDLLERTSMLCESVLGEAGLSWGQLDGVLLVGGSTRMPMVREFVEDRSGAAPLGGVNVDEAVAVGACLKAHEITRPKLRIPGARTIQDVTTHSLGMVALAENRDHYVNAKILPKGSAIPSSSARPFKLRTSAMGNTKLEIYVTQGESDDPRDCTVIGRYVADNIPHAASGEAVLSIDYEYDQSTIVQVTGTDQSGATIPLRKEPVPDDMSWLARPPVTQATHAQHVRVCLAIDVSGSMCGGALDEAKLAARAFLQKMDLASSSVGLVSFGSKAKTHVKAVQDARRLERAIESLSIDGSTKMCAGIREACTVLLQDASDGPKFIVLLTDGGPDSSSKALSAARECEKNGIDIVCIGTDDAEMDFLDRISSTREASVFAGSGQLVNAFGSIAQQITEGGTGLRRR